MGRNIIYIINPISGTRKKKDLQVFLEKQTAAKNIPFQVFPSVASGDYSFLHPIIKEQQVTDVVIAGGDGTVSQVIGSLMNCDVNFGIIPCGSGNGLALAAHIPKQAAKATELIFTGKPVPTDGFTINSHFSCMLCGLGFDAKVAHDFANQSRRGLATYVKEAVKNFFSAKAYKFEILHEGSIIPAEAFFISIANSNQFGNNVTIAPQASLSDGLIDIVIVAKQGKAGLLLQLIKQVRGKNKPVSGSLTVGKKGILYFQAEKLVIRNLSQAPLHIDGDPAETPDEVQIEVKKKCFRLIRPL